MMYRYLHEPDPNVDGSTARVLTINRLQKLVNQDAHRRGLYEGLTGMTDKTLLRRGIWRIMDEMSELTSAVHAMADGDPVSPEAADELADVVITALSFAEQAGIMLGTAIEGKRQFNLTRQADHG